MTKDLKVKDLPIPAKVSATHALKELGFSIRKSAKILKIGTKSVERYLKEIPEDDWRQFSDSLKKLVTLKEEDIATRTLAQIGKGLKKAEFKELIRLYKTIREIQGRVKSISPEEATPPIKIEIKNQRILNIITKAESEAKRIIEQEIENE